MISRDFLVALAAAAVLGAVALPAAAQQSPGTAPQQAQPTPGVAPTARRSQLYGDELFSPEERRAFFDKMKAAQTPEERAKIQAERRATADARAKEKGITLTEPGPGAPKAQ